MSFEPRPMSFRLRGMSSELRPASCEPRLTESFSRPSAKRGRSTGPRTREFTANRRFHRGLQATCSEGWQAAIALAREAGIRYHRRVGPDLFPPSVCVHESPSHVPDV